jgi:hypothetical protein
MTYEEALREIERLENQRIRIRILLEKLLDLPTAAIEEGLSESERELAEARIWRDLKAITGIPLLKNC